MAKCEACGREMLSANGCKYGRIIFDKKHYDRIKVGDPGDFLEGSDPDSRCGDCGAKTGFFHHWGCDCERCPVCRGQLLACDCYFLQLDVFDD